MEDELEMTKTCILISSLGKESQDPEWEQWMDKVYI